MTQKLNNDQISEQIMNLNGWHLDHNAIKKEWIFKDFVSAMAFINSVADVSEKLEHHPEIFNVYNKVILRFYTHHANGLTELDFKSAREIDKIDT
jgi:4a-hydroxytetrahydrobiopterin dehydratase